MFSSFSFSDYKFNAPHRRGHTHGHGIPSIVPIISSVAVGMALGAALTVPSYSKVTIPIPSGGSYYSSVPITTQIDSSPLVITPNIHVSSPHRPYYVAYYCPTQLEYYPKVAVCEVPWQWVYF